jgi:competence protein ComEA
MLDLNTATAQQIAEAVPMVGEEKANAIVTWREQKGLFTNLDELRSLPGFGDKLVESMSMFCEVRETANSR